MLLFFNTKKVETIFVSDSHIEKFLLFFFDTKKVETIFVSDSHIEKFLLLFFDIKKVETIFVSDSRTKKIFLLNLGTYRLISSTNARVRKLSVFFEFSIGASAYLGSRVYWDLADSAKVHQLERTSRRTRPPLVTDLSIFSRCTERKF